MKKLITILLIFCSFNLLAQVKGYKVWSTGLLQADDKLVWQGDTIRKDSLTYVENKIDSIRFGGINNPLGPFYYPGHDSLGNLRDVEIINPQIDQRFKFNGSKWVNGTDVVVNAGSGVDYFYIDSPSDISTYASLSKSPDATIEDEDNVTVNDNRILIESFASPVAGIGSSQIDAGVWIFDIWAYSSSGASCSVDVEVYKRTTEGVEALLFTVNSGAIGSELSLYTVTTIQQAFEINSTDRMVIKVYGVNSSPVTRSVYFVHGGNTHYSHVNTPLVVRHNDLAGINEGQIQHLTTAEKSKLTGIETGAEVNVNPDYNAVSGDAQIFNKPDLTVYVPKTTTVNGHALTGNVSVTKSDLDIANIDNTSDANKPISTATQTALDAKLDDSQKGAANGLAELDASGKVPLAQINDALLGSVKYQGTWNPLTNTPTLPTAATGNKGWYYTANDSALYNGVLYRNRDMIVSNGLEWQKIDNNNYINTVFGRVGNVIANSGDYNTDQVTEGTNKYVSASEKAAITHSNRAAIDLVQNSNTGDNAPNSNSNTYADGKVSDAITDGVTTVAPSQNAVNDALAGKQAAGSYEPAFSKNTAFNKNFGTSTGQIWGYDAHPTTLFGYGITNAIENQYGSDQTANLRISGSASFGVLRTNSELLGYGVNTGYLYFGSGVLDRWIGYNGSEFQLQDGITVRTLWHSGNFDPSTKAPASGSGNYIQNQNSSAQSANMWIDGTVKVVKYLFNDYSSPSSQGQIGINLSGGMYFWGKAGSSSDLNFYNKNGEQVFDVPTGTQNINVYGSVLTASHGTSSNWNSAYSAIYGSTLTNNTIVKWDGSKFVNWLDVANVWHSGNLTDNHTNWDKYNQWDGGATGLTASTGRASLGLVIGTDVLAYRTFGSAANNNTGDFEAPLTFGSGLTRTINAIAPNYGTTSSTIAEGNHAHAGAMFGDGNAGYIPVFTSANNIENSVIYQDGDRIGINHTAGYDGMVNIDLTADDGIKNLCLYNNGHTSRFDMVFGARTGTSYFEFQNTHPIAGVYGDIVMNRLGGSLLVGGYTTDPFTSKLAVDGNIYSSGDLNMVGSITGAVITGDDILANGTITSTEDITATLSISAGTYVYANGVELTSDSTLKKNIKPIENLSRFEKIKFSQFNYKVDSTERLRYGSIAQEVEKIAPELVNKNPEGKSVVNYIDLLIAKVAQMDSVIKAQGERIKYLEDYGTKTQVFINN
jgi:hypothetical protein